jgi:phage terminase large subunit
MLVQIQIPKAYNDLIKPKRYKIYYGGRGGGKSWAFAHTILLMAMGSTKRIICTRAIQNSIKDSVHKLLSDVIRDNSLHHAFIVNQDKIICEATKSEILFKGLNQIAGNIKSFEGADICWIEEAQYVTSKAWEILIPTIRKEGSEIWASFNRETENDPVYKLFVEKPRENSIVKKVNWYDNPFFPDTLKEEMEYDRNTDQEKYMNIWEGEPVTRSEKYIFSGKWDIAEYEHDKAKDYIHGIDWGYANDPTCLIRGFITGKELWIDREVYATGINIDDLDEFFSAVDTSKRWPITADSARPELIAHMNSRGYNIAPAKKGKDSIMAGIEKLRSFEKIHIHPCCKNVIKEMKTYSWRQNKLTGEIINEPEDKNNHAIDALRYAMESMINTNSVYTLGDIMP